MSIDQLCEWVEILGSIPTEVRKQIIAALRAGQGMRDGVEYNKACPLETQFVYQAILDGVKAWDAATKDTK